MYLTKIFHDPKTGSISMKLAIIEINHVFILSNILRVDFYQSRINLYKRGSFSYNLDFDIYYKDYPPEKPSEGFSHRLLFNKEL